MKTKYFIRNIIAGVIGKLLTITLALVLPKLVMENYGSEVNGVISSLMSLAVYLNLLESGIGFASIQALYSLVPYKKNDEINGVLSATDNFFRRNGYIYLTSIIILAVVYPLVVDSTLPFIKIFLIVIILLTPNLLIYFVQGKYSVVLTSHNKAYVETIILTVTGILTNVSRIILIIKGFDVIVMLIATAIFNLISTLLLVFYVKKHYKFVNFKVEPNYNAIAKKNDVLAYRILNMTMKNIDIVLLTFFTNLKVVSVYSFYRMIVSQVKFIPYSVSHSISTSMGQLYYENIEKFKKVYDCYETYFLALNFTLLISVYNVILPFVRLYTAKVTDINYVDPLLAFLMILNPLYEGLRTPGQNLFFWIGHYDKLKKYAIVEAIANIILSCILVYYLKIYGVLLATSISLTYFNVISSVYVYKKILKENVIRLVRKSLIFILTSFAVVYLMNIINLQTTSFVNFFINGVITFVICAISFFGIISLIERQSMKTLLEYVNIYIRHKIKK